MENSFAKELETACKKMRGNIFELEVNRIHQTTVRDENHAFRNVDMPKSYPWENKTDLSI